MDNNGFSSTVFTPILGDPGVVSRAGRKGATKVFKHGRKSPWVPTQVKSQAGSRRDPAYPTWDPGWD